MRRGHGLQDRAPAGSAPRSARGGLGGAAAQHGRGASTMTSRAARSSGDAVAARRAPVEVRLDGARVRGWRLAVDVRREQRLEVPTLAHRRCIIFTARGAPPPLARARAASKPRRTSRGPQALLLISPTCPFAPPSASVNVRWRSAASAGLRRTASRSCRAAARARCATSRCRSARRAPGRSPRTTAPRRPAARPPGGTRRAARRAPPADPRRAWRASGSAPATASREASPPPARRASLSTSTGFRPSCRRMLRNVLWRIVNSHALRFVPRSNCAADRNAFRYVSWTRSSASAARRVSRSAVPYRLSM